MLLLSRFPLAHRLLIIDQLRDRRSIGADCASFAARRELDLMKFHFKGIISKQISNQQITDSGDKLNSLHCLQGTDHAAHGADHAGLFTGWNGILRRRILENTSVAGAFSRNNGRKLTLEPYDTGM